MKWSRLVSDPNGRTWAAVVGVGALLVVCCALPVLIAGGVLAGLGGVLGSPWLIGLGVLVVAAAVALTMTRNRHGSCEAGTGAPGCCGPDRKQPEGDLKQPEGVQRRTDLDSGEL
jgi:hypothetical protein